MKAMGQDDLAEYHDEYREALERVIAAMDEGKQPPSAEAAPEPAGQVVGLVAALNASTSRTMWR
ncbi:hypothetical protein [Streptomyces pristinaespiralis]|uniref:hypothetical protein n=1 Tax=Streptomyces pristinaespiralis TaxID=38300 RepID=UPI0033D1A27E